MYYGTENFTTLKKPSDFKITCMNYDSLKDWIYAFTACGSQLVIDNFKNEIIYKENNLHKSIVQDCLVFSSNMEAYKNLSEYNVNSKQNYLISVGDDCKIIAIRLFNIFSCINQKIFDNTEEDQLSTIKYCRVY